MKLFDEQGNEYEFESLETTYPPEKDTSRMGTLKPLDTWPIKDGSIYELQIDLPDYGEGSLFKFYREIAGGWEYYEDISDEKGNGSHVETINRSLADWLSDHYEDPKYLKAWQEKQDE